MLSMIGNWCRCVLKRFPISHPKEFLLTDKTRGFAGPSDVARFGSAPKESIARVVDVVCWWCVRAEDIMLHRLSRHYRGPGQKKKPKLFPGVMGRRKQSLVLIQKTSALLSLFLYSSPIHNPPSSPRVIELGQFIWQQRSRHRRWRRGPSSGHRRYRTGRQ